MEDLSNTIYRYYFDNFESMPLDKQFHLASRLYLWCQDDQAKQKLASLKSWFTSDDQATEAINRVVEDMLKKPVFGSKNASELRKPYFENYPRLKTYLAALFRLNFLESIYGIDARAAFTQRFPKMEMDRFAARLLKDQEAIAVLSTHAINFLYLYARRLIKDGRAFDPKLFLEIGQESVSEDLIHLQLKIYLYTHCIIGESLFYERALPQNPIYNQMIGELENLITRHFDSINLDNKFEFLVCARLVGRQSHMEKAIYDEAAKSLSPEGSFLIDIHNKNPQSANIDLATSEHRNVLFLMSQRPYTPA